MEVLDLIRLACIDADAVAIVLLTFVVRHERPPSKPVANAGLMSKFPLPVLAVVLSILLWATRADQAGTQPSI